MAVAIFLGSQVKGLIYPLVKTLFMRLKQKHGTDVLDLEMYFPNSERTAEYKGEWKNGKRTGYGVLILQISKSRLDKYEGEFKDGKRTGHGTYSFANHRYVGNFIDGKKRARRIPFANGDRYIGEFQNDKMHGEGIYTYATGKVCNGLFKEGNLLIKKDSTPIKRKHDYFSCFNKVSCLKKSNFPDA